jgi:hypothetical protein
MSGWIRDRKVTVQADITFEAKHFNPRCNCNIPEAWLIEAININEICRPIGDFDHYQLYAYGQTKEEAIANFTASVKEIFPQGGVIKFS